MRHEEVARRWIWNGYKEVIASKRGTRSTKRPMASVINPGITRRIPANRIRPPLLSACKAVKLP